MALIQDGVCVRVLFAFKRNAQATSREIITFPRSNVLCSVYRMRGHQLRRLIYVFNSWFVYRFPYGLTYSPKALLTALPLKLLLCACVCVHVVFLPANIPLIASLCSTAKVIIAEDEKGNASLYAIYKRLYSFLYRQYVIWRMTSLLQSFFPLGSYLTRLKLIS